MKKKSASSQPPAETRKHTAAAVPAKRSVGKVAAQTLLEAPAAGSVSTGTPNSFVLTAAQQAFLRTLEFRSDYEIAHSQKVAPEVGNAFSAQVLQTIAANSCLGGPERSALIRADIDLQSQLLQLAAVVNPIARLVSQNLLLVNASLGKHLAEPVKIATALKRSQPELLEALAPLVEWSRATHGKARKSVPPKAANA